MESLTANSVEYLEGDTINLVGYRGNGKKVEVTVTIDLVRPNNVAFVTSITGKEYRLYMREFVNGNFSTLDHWKTGRTSLSEVTTNDGYPRS